jgi:hypothetical protein
MIDLMREICKLVLKLDFMAHDIMESLSLESKSIDYMNDFGENLFGVLALKRAATDLVWLILCFFTAS